MATASTRKAVITFTGDVEYGQAFAADGNASSPAEIAVVNLVAGDNDIDIPPTPTGVTIIPPALNELGITLKGDAADVGIPLALTSPTSLGVASGFSVFILAAEDDIDGVRLIWT